MVEFAEHVYDFEKVVRSYLAKQNLAEIFGGRFSIAFGLTKVKGRILKGDNTVLWCESIDKQVNFGLALLGLFTLGTVTYRG